MNTTIAIEPEAGPEIRPLAISAMLRVAAAVTAAWLAMLVFEYAPGSVVALVYALPLAALGFVQHEKGWTRNPAILFALAALSVLAIFIEPSFLNMLTGFGFVAAAGFATRGAGVDDGLRMARRVLIDIIKAPFWIAFDALASLPQIIGLKRSNMFAAAAVPVLAAGVFGFMLLAANPVLERLVTDLIDFSVSSILSWRLIIVFPTVLVLCWAVLRNSPGLRGEAYGPVDARWHQMFFKPASVIATLVLLNGFFLIENLLDIQHVWLEGQLPAGFSHAAYVHRGAYTLIATVIMAAGFIMVALRPGSETNDSPVVRWLVYLFAAQNFLLVASSAKRTLSYIDVFGMTEWRLAGLIWMGLVGFGLALTMWRVMGQRDNRWLINKNVHAAALLMLFCAFADLRPFIVDWNVERATASGISSFDVDYNTSLGITVIPALAKYAATITDKSFWGPRVDTECRRMRRETAVTQSRWQSWTLRYEFAGDLREWSGC